VFTPWCGQEWKHHGLHDCKFVPLVNYYTVCMQLHGKTIVWLQLYVLETIVRESYSKMISELDISSMSMRY